MDWPAGTASPSHLAALKDSRQAARLPYPPPETLLLLCAILAGGGRRRRVGVWCDENLERFHADRG